MGKRGCLSGIISGCFLLLLLAAALCFFLWNWYLYQKAEAERNNISLTTQMVRSIQTIGDPPPKYDEIKRTEIEVEKRKD